MSSFTAATNPLFGLPLGLLSGWINYLSGYLKSTPFCRLTSRFHLESSHSNKYSTVCGDFCLTLPVSLSNSIVNKESPGADPWSTPTLTLNSSVTHTAPTSPLTYIPHTQFLSPEAILCFRIRSKVKRLYAVSLSYSKWMIVQGTINNPQERIFIHWFWRQTFFSLSSHE